MPKQTFCALPVPFDKMRDLDLGPNDYRKRDPRTGRWVVPDDPKLARFGFFTASAILAFIFWHRSELSAHLLFGAAAMVAFCAGIMLSIWLKDRY